MVLIDAWHLGAAEDAVIIAPEVIKVSNILRGVSPKCCLTKSGAWRQHWTDIRRIDFIQCLAIGKLQ